MLYLLITLLVLLCIAYGALMTRFSLSPRRSVSPAPLYVAAVLEADVAAHHLHHCEWVPEAEIITRRSQMRAQGLVVTSSSPVGGGYLLTTAPRRS